MFKYVLGHKAKFLDDICFVLLLHFFMEKNEERKLHDKLIIHSDFPNLMINLLNKEEVSTKESNR